MPKRDIVKHDEEGTYIEINKGILHCPRCKGKLIEAEFGTTATPENTVEGYICEEECGFEETDSDIVRAVKFAVKTDAPTAGYLYVGIDPGANGAIAWCSDWLFDMKVIKCPSDAKGMVDSLRHIKWDFQGKGGYLSSILVGMEKVWARPTNAVRAAFKFGTNYGQWLGALAGEEMTNVYHVTPREWQKGIGIKKGMEKADRKRTIKKKMAEVFPEIKVTLINADAIGIAKHITENDWLMRDLMFQQKGE